ncbi:MAG: redoxin family protein [Phycisphaerales bacterium]|nr:redoxin family protein [Phycisphaerales bacterium]
MKRSILGLSVIGVVLCAGIASIASAQGVAQPAKQAEAESKPLAVGDAAPALKVGKWVKGSAVNSFEKGHVYVVEGWATWCGPCKTSIPHLTEMAHKTKGKATFIGVSVWENDPAYTQKVEDFVTKMGDKMDYVVAIDTVHDDSGHVAKNWLKAAGQDGIPSAFIVNGEGKIAWIGHPMTMQEPLDKVIAGTWDIDAAAKAFKDQAAVAAKERADREKQMAAMKPVMEAMKAKDFSKASQLLDEMIAKDPANSMQLKMTKFSYMMRGDESIAYATAKDLAQNEFKSNAQGLNQLAWTILDSKTLKNPDYDLAHAIAVQAVELTKGEDGMILDSLALAQFKKGDVDAAIKTQTKALELAKDKADEETMADMKSRLDQFKAAKK